MEKVINVPDGPLMRFYAVAILNIFVLNIMIGRQTIMNLIKEKENYPNCPFCKTEMCQVTKTGENTYYQCFETPKGKFCGHKEYTV